MASTQDPPETAGQPRLKVVFKLEVGDEGWPPAGSERLWAVRVSEDTARLENISFFVRGYASGDVVRFSIDKHGVCWVREAVEYSVNCTVRVIPAKDGRRDEVRQAVLDAFAALGATGEGLAQFGMVALNVPAHADIAAVKRLVIEGSRDGRWHYEEGCVTDEWRRAAVK